MNHGMYSTGTLPTRRVAPRATAMPSSVSMSIAARAQLPSAAAPGGRWSRSRRAGCPCSPGQAQAVRAAVAASRQQLVLQVLDGVGVGVLVALGARRRRRRRPRVLEAHAAFGRVVARLLVEGQLVGAHELVAAAHGHVALEYRVGVGAGEQVALDIGGGFAGGVDVQSFRRTDRIGERRHHVADRAQPPVLRRVVGGTRLQAKRDAQGQGKQAQDGAHGRSGAKNGSLACRKRPAAANTGTRRAFAWASAACSDAQRVDVRHARTRPASARS